ELVRAGVRQFLDIGSGLPTAGNVHEIAHEIDPEVRVVYIDNDPVVLAHGRALLADEVTTTVVQADLRHPDGIFDNPEVRALLDVDQPVAVFLRSILHHFDDSDDPWALSRKIRDRISSGSYMLITHFYDSGDPVCREVEQALLEGGLGSGWFRTKEQIERFFEGMDVLEPGVVAANEWRPDAETPTDSTTHHLLAGGLARKPQVPGRPRTSDQGRTPARTGRGAAACSARHPASPQPMVDQGRKTRVCSAASSTALRVIRMGSIVPAAHSSSWSA